MRTYRQGDAGQQRTKGNTNDYQQHHNEVCNRTPHRSGQVHCRRVVAAGAALVVLADRIAPRLGVDMATDVLEPIIERLYALDATGVGA